MSEIELAPEQELKKSAEALNEDGTVDVTILDWQKTGSNVKVTYRTPTMDRRSESMDWPEPGEDFEEYKFVRLLREAGLDVSEPDQLHGHVTSARKNVSWSLEPSPPVSVRERVGERVSAKSLVVYAHIAVIVLSLLLAILIGVVMVL